jgi:transposase-like protein
MPYKCEKIKIANTQYDRRIKLSDDDKEEIQDRYFNRGESMRSLSRCFKVDRQVIKYTVDPNYKIEFYKANRERVKPEIDKATRNAYMKRHRDYKKELFQNGLIKKQTEGVSKSK